MYICINRYYRYIKMSFIPDSFMYYFEQLFLTGSGDYGSIIGGGQEKYITASDKKLSYKKMNQIIDTFHQSGWKKNTIQKSLHGIHDRLLDDHLLDDIVTPSFAYAQYHKIGYKGSIYKTLIACGIYHIRAVQVEKALRTLYNSSYTYDQLMYIAIDYLLGYYKPLRNKETAYLFPFSANTWNSLPSAPSKQIINVEYPCMMNLYKNVSEVVQTIPYNKKTHRLFFHATNWEGCIHISNKINHMRGRKCLDFGYSPSFYVTPTLYDAVEWGGKRSGNFSHEVAIMIFIVPVNFKEQLDYMELTGELWKKVVVTSRRCRSDLHTQQLIPGHDIIMKHNGDREMSELENKDMIYGAILQNPVQVLEKGSPPIAFRKKQMASKSELADRYLQKCLFGAICFCKHGSERNEGNEGNMYKHMYGGKP